MWGDIAIAFLLAFITSFVTVPYTIKLAYKKGAIDIPNERKVNKKPIPRIGGIAVIVGFLVASLYLIVQGVVEKSLILNDSSQYGKKIVGFLIGIVIIGTVSYIDDIKNLKPWQKLIAQVIAAIIAYSFGIRIDTINDATIQPILSFILTVGWVVGITNAINLIDGLDGLSSGITLISSLSLLIIFATNNSPILSIILITSLSGSIVGFMPFNIYPAKTFLGDVGAQFLGFALSIIAILGVAKTVTMVVLIAPILVLGLPIFDTVFAIFRRIKKGKSVKAIFKPDKGHLHHILMRQGFTQKQAVAILYAASATLGMLAIILIDEGAQKAISFLIVLIIIIAIGFKNLKKYKRDLINENIKQGLVDKKDIDLYKEEEDKPKNKEDEKNNKK